jgi:hypothetical protein
MRDDLRLAVILCLVLWIALAIGYFSVWWVALLAVVGAALIASLWMRYFTVLLVLSLLLVGLAEAHPAVSRLAEKWRGPLLREVRLFWPAQSPAVFFGQLHQESAWREDARSAYASGLAQFTPSTALAMQQGYSAELRALCSEAAGCPLDGRWALRAMVLYDRELWAGFGTVPDATERWAFTLAGYNGGPGWAARERRETAARGGDGARWFGHVEQVCLRAAWACRENRAYPRLILLQWTPIYHAWLGARGGTP